MSATHSRTTYNQSKKIYHINVRAIHLCTTDKLPMKVYNKQSVNKCISYKGDCNTLVYNNCT